MINQQNRNLKYLKIYNTIFVFLNISMNAFFISITQIYYEFDKKEQNEKWATWYAIVLCYFFIWQAAIFQVIGYKLCRRLDIYFSEYYIENRCKIILAILGLIIPLYLRAFYNLAIYQLNYDLFDSIKENRPLIYYILEFLVFVFIPSIFQIWSTFIFAIIKKS